MPVAGVRPQQMTRNDLFALARGRDPYAFLAPAVQAITQVPEDHELRMQVLRHYAMLGLIGPALEVTNGLPPDVQAQPDVAAVIGQLKALPTGRVPWSHVRARFDGNLEALAGRDGLCETLRDAWARQGEQLALYQCRDGNFQISTCDDRGQRTWLPALLDHKGQAEGAPIPRTESELLPTPYLFEGMGLGWFFGRVLEATRHVYLNYSPAVYVIESNPLALAATLHLHDWRALLADERVLFFVGPDCTKTFRQTLLEQDPLLLPGHALRVVRWGAPIDPPTETVLQEVERIRMNERLELEAKVTAIYEGRDTAYWARRYREASADDPLRVLLAVSRHTTYLQYAMRDIARALESRGMRTLTVTEDRAYSLVSSAEYLRAACSFQPDLYLLIDHFRHEYGTLMPANVPFVGWVQDLLLHLHCRDTGERLGPLDFFVAWDPNTLIRHFGYPGSRGMAWKAATDDRVFSAEPMPAEALAPHGCDFSFVSNQSKPPDVFFNERRPMFREHPGALKLVDALYEALGQSLAEDPRLSCAGLWTWFVARYGRGLIDPLAPEAAQAVNTHFLFPICELAFRQQALEWVADYCDRTNRTLHLYGNGWDAHPRFARYAKGFAENGEPLRAIYQAARINLQITSFGAVHQRLLDGLAAGGFFLVRYSPADVTMEPTRRLLDVMRRFDVQPDTEYTRDAIGELTESVEGLVPLRVVPPFGDRFRIPQVLFDRLQANEESGYQRLAGAVFDCYDEVSFASREDFERLAERYLADESSRRRIQSSMRQAVLDRFTYGAFVDALMTFLQERLDAMANGGA